MCLRPPALILQWINTDRWQYFEKWHTDPLIQCNIRYVWHEITDSSTDSRTRPHKHTHTGVLFVVVVREVWTGAIVDCATRQPCWRLGPICPSDMAGVWKPTSSHKQPLWRRHMCVLTRPWIHRSRFHREGGTKKSTPQLPKKTLKAIWTLTGAGKISYH